MKNRKKDILLGELIGKQIRIIQSTDKALIAMKGIVMNETKGLLELKKLPEDKNNPSKIIKIPKQNIIFELHDNEKRYEINGKNIVFAPEKRTKKLR